MIGVRVVCRVILYMDTHPVLTQVYYLASTNLILGYSEIDYNLMWEGGARRYIPSRLVQRDIEIGASFM